MTCVQFTGYYVTSEAAAAVPGGSYLSPQDFLDALDDVAAVEPTPEPPR